MENIALIWVSIWVRTLFHIHCHDHRGKAVYRTKFTADRKLIEFLCDMPGTTDRDGSLCGSHFMHASWQS